MLGVAIKYNQPCFSRYLGADDRYHYWARKIQRWRADFGMRGLGMNNRTSPGPVGGRAVGRSKLRRLNWRAYA